MSNSNSTLTAERLRELLHYDPETGAFAWTVKRRTRANIGDIAGSLKNNGYIEIKLEGRMYKSHRLAWFYFFGHWPTHEIDHINGVRTDNRIRNLRDVSKSVNQQNRRATRTTNRVGLLGVQEAGKSWMAIITIKGKKTYIGSYETPELAHAAYITAKRTYHEGCTI